MVTKLLENDNIWQAVGAAVCFVCLRRSTARNGPTLPETYYLSAGGRLYAVDGAFLR